MTKNAPEKLAIAASFRRERETTLTKKLRRAFLWEIQERQQQAPTIHEDHSSRVSTNLHLTGAWGFDEKRNSYRLIPSA